MAQEAIKPAIIPTGEATAILPARDNRGKPITVIGTEAIRETFDARCLEQALNSRGAPGVSDLILNPDAHVGYGAQSGQYWFLQLTFIPAQWAWTSNAR